MKAYLVVALATLSLAGCSSTAGTGTADEGGKDYVVDSSGWWVPQDPLGCLTETTQCQMAVAKTRAYKKGNIVLNVVTHGEVIHLECKALAPAEIFNSLNTYTKYWYYADVKGKHWWVPDIYVAKDDAGVTAMAEGVKDCPADTPGVNG